MDSVKLDLKVFAGGGFAGGDCAGGGNGSGPSVDPAAVIDVFHRWIRNRELDELMIDVADYSHVPDGPAVVLVCHDAQYSVDRTGGELGLLYSRRRETGREVSSATTLSERLRSVFRMALLACGKLEGEDALGGDLLFPVDRFLLRVNDRLVGSDEASALEVALSSLVGDLFWEGVPETETFDDAGRVAIRIRAPEAVAVGELLSRLG